METARLSDHLAAATITAQQQNIETVQHIFGCFAKGDVPGIQGVVAENVDWQHNGDAGVVPFFKNYRGRAGVADFFRTLGESIKVTGFSVSNFRTQNNQVLNDTHVEAEVISTGKTYSVDAEYVWTFDAHGKVSRWRTNGDMSAVENAFRK
jgi:ketosteroid isomerase-like protein